jgi:hypothetical protein
VSDLTIGAVMEVLRGEYHGGVSGIERVARERAARLLMCRAEATWPPRRWRARSACRIEARTSSLAPSLGGWYPPASRRAPTG